MNCVRKLPLNAPVSSTRVKTLPASTPTFGLRNCVNVACISVVLGSLGSEINQEVFTGTSVPESLNRLSPKLLPA